MYFATVGHFQTNRRLHRCRPISPVLLHELTFVLNNAPGPPRLPSGLSLTLRQPLPTEAPGKRLRGFRLNKAEHYEVGFIAAQEVRERRRR
jgi:hypothetical protein